MTVRFETAETGPGPVRTFAADDPALTDPARRLTTDDEDVVGQAGEARPGRPAAAARTCQQARTVDDPDDRVAAGDRVVGEEHQRLPPTADLYRAGDDALARQLLVDAPLQLGRRAVEPQARRGWTRAATAYVAATAARRSSSNQSSRGPSRSRAAPRVGRRGAARGASAAGAGRAGRPSGSASPAATGAGPARSACRWPGCPGPAALDAAGDRQPGPQPSAGRPTSIVVPPAPTTPRPRAGAPSTVTRHCAR